MSMRASCDFFARQDLLTQQYFLYHSSMGAQATTVFQSFFELETRAEAVTAGRALLRLGVFRHVTNDHDFKDAELFYRLQLHSEPLVLNSWRTFSTPEETKSSDDSGSGDGDDDGSSITTASTETGESAKRRKRTRTLFRYEGRRAHRMLERWYVRLAPARHLRRSNRVVGAPRCHDIETCVGQPCCM